MVEIRKWNQETDVIVPFSDKPSAFAIRYVEREDEEEYHNLLSQYHEELYEAISLGTNIREVEDKWKGLKNSINKTGYEEKKTKLFYQGYCVLQNIQPWTGYFQKRFYHTSLADNIYIPILNTLVSIWGTNDSEEIYQNTAALIFKLFSKGDMVYSTHPFGNVPLEGINSTKVNNRYVADRLEYINELLENNGLEKLVVTSLKPYMYHFDTDLYMQAAVLSCRKDKTALQQYESSILREISAAGGKISKWKNERTIFALASKLYPDAIYQYHSATLCTDIPAAGIQAEDERNQIHKAERSVLQPVLSGLKRCVKKECGKKKQKKQGIICGKDRTDL